jgi:hypothetical protein
MFSTPFLRKTTLRRLAAAVVFVSFFILAGSAAYSQTTLGTILGSITDRSGATVPNASVQLRNEATNVVTRGVTTADGDYVFANVPPGSYELTFQAAGFAEHKISRLVLEVSQTVRRDAALELATVSSSVQVTAEHTLVQTETTSVGGVIETRQISRIPLNGRTNTFGLLALAPGVQSSGTNPRISGSSWIGTNATMDGVVNMEMENARLSNADPSLESIQEFRVIDSTGSAEYGAGTAQVIVSSKSGTNDFHGSLFAYNRNRALTAKNFFATGLPKAPYNRNEFGGSLGGPILRNRLFFFGSYEGLVFRSAVTNQSAQPTAALLLGDFSGLPPLIDPFTQAPFPGNRIPSERISSVARNLFPYFAAPNRPTTAPGGLGTNYLVNVRSKQDNHRYQGRVDYSINTNNSLFVRYFYVDRYNESPGITEKTGANYQPLTNQNLAINYTRLLSPTLINVATFGWMRTWDQFLSQNNAIEPSSLIPGIPKSYPGLGGVPAVSITGFTGLSDGLGSGDTIPAYHFSDTLTRIRGRHTVKGGFSLLRYKFLSYGNQAPQYGAVSFTGRYTNNAFADFLLGYAAGSTIPLAPIAVQPQNERYGFFIQDDWRITDRLTMNIGLRYDLPTLYENTIGGMANWYPDVNALVVIKGDANTGDYPTLPIVPGSSVGLNTGNYIRNDLNQFAPRMGLAWRPLRSSRLVVRAGYGMYYESMPWKFGSYVLGANPPFSGTRSFEPLPGTEPSLFLQNAFPTGSGSVPSGIGITALTREYEYPMTHQWNFTLESQVASNMVVRASYLGSERQHSGTLNPINTPPPAPGAVQPRRPYQPFGNINVFENSQTSNTQQLQLSAQRRFSSGLSFGVEYAWTKALSGSLFDQSLPTVPDNRRLDRGNDPQIRQHYMVANYVWELPVGRGKRYLSSLSRLPNAILGGWETSGIVTLGSGLPFSVVFDSTVQGWPSSRADIVGDPHVANPSLSQWFNPAAFVLPAPFRYGNSAPNSLFGPGLNSWDVAALKNFRLGESLNLQFRSEFFNVLNHPSFGNPNSNISNTTRVGTITSTSNQPRVIQFALRLEL